MYYSYAMGTDESILKLQSHGFIIENDGENYTVSFSEAKAPIWEEYISSSLAVGYWNEYIANDRVIFIFRLEDSIKRYEVYGFQNDEVLSLCEKLCECKIESLKAMLSENHFYKGILK